MSSAKLTLIGLNRYTENLFEYLTLPEGIDKEVVINNILLRGGEYEVMYSEPDFLKLSMATWSKKWKWTFEKWVKALAEEYSPIDNYDRYEEWSDKMDASSGNTSKVSAFNSKVFQPAGNNEGNTKSDSTHKGRIHGNIGVTTSAAIWKEYQDTQKWNLYDKIADIFLKEYVIPISD